jgi:hypothetical protein
MFMATNTHFRSTQLAIWLLPIALMAGCSTANLTSEVGSFAEATKAFSTQASETYSEVNKTTFDRRFVDLAAIENSNIIANELKNNNHFIPIITDDILRPRLELLFLLRNYATGLGELTTTNSKKDIDVAAQNLGGAFDGLKQTISSTPGGANAFSNINGGIITATVSAFGNAIAEEQRREAIKAIITKFNPAVQEAVRLLGDNSWGAIKDLQTANLTNILNENKDAYKREFSNSSFTQRQQRLHEIGQIYTTLVAVDPTFEKLRASAASVGKAHQALFDGVSIDRLDTDEIANRIAELSAIVQSLKALRDSVENKQ